MNEKWEEAVKNMYSDASDLVSDNSLNLSCLAKAILMCLVSDITLDTDERIPTAEVTWDDLRWRSIVFLSAAESGAESPKLRIPRLLWGCESKLHKKLREWVDGNCHFALDDLLTTVLSLCEDTGEASAKASGRPWEKMFVSALVAIFFVYCWKEGEDPTAHFVPLHKLLPQKNGGDNSALANVEVCLANGVQTCSSENLAVRPPGDGFDWKAIHANWNIKAAHHNMILPVRNRKSKKRELWAVSSRSVATARLKATWRRQSSIDREVAGLIQAMNQRGEILTNRRMKTKLSQMQDEERYAEVSINEGNVSYVMCSLP